jgi:hypothetical protein
LYFVQTTTNIGNTSSEGNDDTDAALLTSFVKLAGVELLRAVPRTVRVAFRDSKKLLMQSQLDVGEDTVECQESKQISVTNAALLDDPLLIDLRSEKCQLLGQADELMKALQPTVEAPDAVALDTSCKILNSHCIGAYRTLSSSYLSTAGTNLGPFDDEETRAFYCDLPDLLSTKPPDVTYHLCRCLTSVALHDPKIMMEAKEKMPTFCSRV